MNKNFHWWLHCTLAVAQCNVIAPVCLWVCVGGSVTTITTVCIDPHQTEFVVKGSDHVQLIKFWLSRTHGKGSVAGRNFLAPPYYSQCAVFASPLSAFFHLLCFYEAVVCPVAEYACPVWPIDQSDCIKSIQRRVMKIIFTDCAYTDACQLANMPCLVDRHEQLTRRFFSRISVMLTTASITCYQSSVTVV